MREKTNKKIGPKGTGLFGPILQKRSMKCGKDSCK